MNNLKMNKFKKKKLYKNNNYENIPDDFYWRDYIEINSDLTHMTELEAKIHYENYGYKENRKYKYNNISQNFDNLFNDIKTHLPNDFNALEYIELNEDLRHMSEIEANAHYENYGYKENRKYKYENIPDDFNWTDYIEINSDLTHMSEIEAKIHYENYGYKENRKYKYSKLSYNFDNNNFDNNNFDNNNFDNNNYDNLPYDFNWKDYIQINSDLAHLSEIEAKNHYKNYGYKENRKYKYENIPDDFNWKDYIEINSDLTHMSEIEAKVHYENYGYKENRTFTKIITYFEEIDDEYIVLNNLMINKLNIDSIDNYDNLILIVDYNLSGGGTNTFLESIIIKYKESQNFLIVRNINNLVRFTINDEYYLNSSFNETEGIYFLEKNKNKIVKIFINHTLNHSINFINKLFELNKKVCYITHDYLSITNNNPSPFYEEIQLNNKNPNFDINKCNIIVSQNYYTLQNFFPFLNKNITKIISPLPDYRNKDIKINTDNQNIVIGILGRISDIKGKYIIKKIIEKSKNYKINFKFVVFGELNILNFNNSYEYKNINELNDLLTIHKPNLLLEASIWPETYSYTLSLSKITDLPILYYNKNFPSVVVNRLKNYEKAYAFNNSNEFYNLAINKKQSYFYTINKNIYFPKFWHEYFINFDNELTLYKNINNNYKNIVLITSKLIKCNVSYTYSKNRCIYSEEECFEQTINTINSIKKYIPNAYIVLFDNSKIDIEKSNIIEKLTDKFINITDNKILNYYTNHRYKSLGELSQMCFFYSYFFKNININSFNNFFKISGRYFINNNFDYTKFDNNYNIFKKNTDIIQDRNYYYTSFYKLNNEIISYFFNQLIDRFNNKHLYLNQDYEVFVPDILKNKVHFYDTLGITQIFAPFFKIDDI